jgi:predicted  nucleic acid-binding Zn-ribbon protein
MSYVQEIILRKAEMAVKSLEDDLRMINIEIAETERKIKVARDKILVVPKMAEKVIEIQ